MTVGESWPSTHTSLLLQVRRLDNRPAWSRFVDLYGPLIYRFCRKRGLQSADADDVTQEVFKQIGRAIPMFEYNRQRGRFRGWLGTIARHEIRRFLKKKNRPGQGLGGSDSDQAINSIESVDSEWNDAFNLHIVQTAFDQIQPEFDAETWKLFELVWFGQRKPRDVAAELQCDAEHVYRVTSKVKRRLKRQIKQLVSDVTD